MKKYCIKRIGGKRHMTLKEAFTYQNFLEEIITKGETYLGNTGFITTTKELHKKNAANPEVEDEEVIAKKPYDVAFGVAEVIDFVVDAIKEKEALSKAISEAKKNLDFDIDAAISMNGKKHGFINILKMMNRQKSSETTVQGTGYRINAIDGNQMRYFYDVNRVITIDFDRNDVKGLIKKYVKDCDDTSAKIELTMITANVEFSPRWDLNDTFEDIIESTKGT